MEKIDLKSPVFTSKPGWGGKSKKWLFINFSSKILPIISFISLFAGLYLVFMK